MKILASAIILSLASCGAPSITAPPAPKTPAQVVFEVKASEGAALAIFIRYKALPSCAPANHPPICSDAALVAKVQQADVVAAKAIDTAETAVRTPGFGADTISTLLASAQAAVGYLTSSTQALKVN